MSDRLAKIAALSAALGDDFSVLDHEDFLEITDAEHYTVGIALVAPPAVEIELSCVFSESADDDEALQAMGNEADRVLRDIVAPAWVAKGFEPAKVGEIREAEVVDDETQYILSYDLGMLCRCENIPALAEAIRWAAGQEVDFFI